MRAAQLRTTALALVVPIMFVSRFVVCADAPKSATALLERIKVSSDGKAFETANSKTRFRPFGFNYGNRGRLMEDFWDTEWSTLADDFGEIKAMGGNVVRVHLQYGRFMKSVTEPKPEAFAQLTRLLHLAESTGLYLDLTGLACYRPGDTPPWYDALDDAKRWDAQATFWRAVAETCAESPAVFCYDLMNEPLSPGDRKEKWGSGALFGGYDFLQMIARVPTDRPREQRAIEWIDRLTQAIREKDGSHLITVGMLPWVTGWGHLSGFVPKEIAPHVDILSVHIYPKTKQPEEAARALRECVTDKPVVIEETFPLECTPEEWEAFLRASREIACGWISHYDGATEAELGQLESKGELTLQQAGWLVGLRSFSRLRPELLKPD